MKFLPTVTLDSATFEALRSGQLKLQRGQWVKITPHDPQSKPSRFISVQPGYINIVHPTGPMARGTFPVDVFKRRCGLLRKLETALRTIEETRP